MYKLALQNKYRYDTVKGFISVEDLFCLPLTGNNEMNLNSVAKSIAADIKQDGEESFVDTYTINPTNQFKLDIVKDIIKDKLLAKEKAKLATANAERKQKILEILASKESDALASKSTAELLAELESL